MIWIVTYSTRFAECMGSLGDILEVTYVKTAGKRRGKSMENVLLWNLGFLERHTMVFKNIKIQMHKYDLISHRDPNTVFLIQTGPSGR